MFKPKEKKKPVYEIEIYTKGGNCIKIDAVEFEIKPNSSMEWVSREGGINRLIHIDLDEVEAVVQRRVK